jgi:hypothetical protein
MLKAGSVTITATISETDQYNSSDISTTFEILKLNSNLSNFTINNREWSNVPFTLTPPTKIVGNGSLSYVSNDTSIATINSTNGEITMIKGGLVTITSTISETNQYNSSNISATFVIFKLNTNLLNSNLSNFTISDRSWSNIPFTITQPEIIAGDGSISYISNDTSIATINSTTREITMIKAGSVTITAIISETDAYNLDYTSATFVISKLSSNLSNFTISDKYWTSIPFTLIQPTKIAGNGSLSYVSNDTSIATVNSLSGIITMIGIGSVTIIATISETDQYNSSDISATFVISKSQSNLSDFTISDRSWSNVPFTLIPPTIIAGNGTLSYVSSDTTIATINNTTGVITMVKAGSVTITATISETSQYNSLDISTTFIISKSQSNLSNFIINNKTYGDVPFIFNELTVIGNGIITYSSDNTEIATVNESRLVNIIKAGTTRINVNISETDQYLPANIYANFVISPKPINIIATNQNKTYDGSIYNFNGSEFIVEQMIGVESITSVSLSCLGIDVSNSPYIINVSNAIADSNTLLSNYIINYSIGLLTVNPRPITIKASDQFKTYDGVGYDIISSEFTINSGTMVSGQSIDNVSLSCSGINVSDSPYIINISNAVGNSNTLLSNYNISYSTGLLTINPRPITIKASDQFKTYDGIEYIFNNYEFSINSGTMVFGQSISTVNLSCSGINVSSSPYTINLSNAVTGPNTLLSNYIISYSTGLLTINKANLIVNADSKNVSYIGSLYDSTTANCSVSYTGFVNGETSTVLGGTLGFSISNTPLNVGVYTITPNGFSSTNYNITYNTGTLTINKVNLIVTADNKSVTYTGFPYGPVTANCSVTYTGFVNDETSTVLGGTIEFTISNTPINVGSYTITPNGLSSVNYNISYTTGSLTITARAITLKASNQTKTYNGLSYNFTGSEFTINSGTIVSGQSISSVSLSCSGINVSGSPYTINVSNAIAGSNTLLSNYNISYSTGLLTINQANLIVKADNKNVTYIGSLYNSTTANCSVTYTGFVNTETSTSLSGTLGFTISNNPINVGTYIITPNGLSSTNYNITYNNGMLIINQANLIVRADNKSTVYTGTTYSLNNCSATYIGFVNAETLTSLGGTLGFTISNTPLNAGTYMITPNGLNSTNYNITYDNGTLTINKVNLTVKADNKTVSYIGSTYSPVTANCSVTYTGFINDETSTVLGGTLGFTISNTPLNVGVYTITPNSLTSTNYNITYNTGTLTITAIAITIKASNQSKTYNGLSYNVVSSEFTINSGSMVSGQSISTVNLSCSGINVSGSPYTINVSNAIAGSNTLLSNYIISYTTGLLTINQANLIVKADNKSVTYVGSLYNSTTANCSVTYTGFVNGETSTVLGGTIEFTISNTPLNVGVYTITSTGFSSTNYNITYNAGTLTITARSITIKASNQSKTYDGSVFNFIGTEFTIDSGSMVSGQGISTVNLECLETNVSGSPYTINVSNAIAGSDTLLSNYIITYSTGLLTITTRAITIKASNQTKTYDGSVYNVIGSEFTINSGTMVSGQSISTVNLSCSGINVSGSPYIINVSNASAGSNTLLSNYIISYSTGLLTIIPKAITITASNQIKTFTGEVLNLGTRLFTTIGLVGSQSFSDVTLSSNGINSGTYSIIPSNPIPKSDTLLSNYNITFINGVLSIISVATITINNTEINLDTTEIITNIPIDTTTNNLIFDQILTTTYFDRLNDIIIFINNNLALLNPPTELT